MLEDGHTVQPKSPPPLREVSEFVRDDDPSAFIKIDKHNLLLLGPTGSGKTYLLEYAVASMFRRCQKLIVN